MRFFRKIAWDPICVHGTGDIINKSFGRTNDSTLMVHNGFLIRQLYKIVNSVLSNHCSVACPKKTMALKLVVSELSNLKSKISELNVNLKLVSV